MAKAKQPPQAGTDFTGEEVIRGIEELSRWLRQAAKAKPDHNLDDARAHLDEVDAKCKHLRKMLVTDEVLPNLRKKRKKGAKKKMKVMSAQTRIAYGARVIDPC